MSAKSKQGPNQHQTVEEQEAADQAKALKKQRAAAKRKAMTEAMQILYLLGIQQEALAYAKQGKCPQADVIAAISLLVLTLVQDIIKRAIESIEEDWRLLGVKFWQKTAVITDEKVRKAWKESSRGNRLLSVGLWEDKPSHESMVETLHAMIAGKDLTQDIAQRPELIKFLEELIRMIFNPRFVKNQTTPAKQAQAQAIRSKAMEKFDHSRDTRKTGVDGNPLKWDDLYTEEDWQKFKCQNSFFKEADYGEQKGPFNKEDFDQIVVMVFMVTTPAESEMDKVAEKDHPLNPKWFDEEGLIETLKTMIEKNSPGIDIKVTKAGRRQFLELIMHTSRKWFGLCGQMSTHRGLKRKIGEEDREGATEIVGKEDDMEKFEGSMKATLKKQTLFKPSAGGPFSKFM